MAGELLPTNVVRGFTRIRDRFPNIHHHEEEWTMGFRCMDGQIAWMVRHEPSLLDDEVMQALAAAGLRAYDVLAGDMVRGWNRLEPRVQILAERLSATFDPDLNGELYVAAEQAWQTPEDREYHFEISGAIIWRLMDSVKFYSKQNPRGYCQWVTSFIAQMGDDLENGKIHWTVWSHSLPQWLDSTD
jgi:hypothetical protein